MRPRRWQIGALIALCGVLPGCGGSQRGDDGATGAVQRPNAAAQDWGLVVRTWVIDDTRGTQVDVYTPDPNEQEGPTPTPDSETAASGRPGSNAPSPSPRGKDEKEVAPVLRPLRPDWRAAIAAVAIAPPVDAATLATWRANSIEIIGVPMERIAALESVLTKVGFRQSQDMGETPRWTQVCVGPEWQGEQRLVLDNGPVMLGAGRLRMLLRTWVVPGATPGPVVTDVEAGGPGAEATPDEAAMVPGAVRVEMAPQHVDAASSRTTLADLISPQSGDTRAGAGEGAARAGLILSRLTAVATLNGDTALLVVASDAGLAAVGDPTTGGWMAQKPDRVGTTTVGPMAPGDMRLGPAILTSSGAGGPRGAGSQRSWTVLILIPRAPDRYELLGL